MEQQINRYLFIGDFDPVLRGFFSKRGEVIWVSSIEEALNQTGNFTLIIFDSNTFTKEISGELSVHYPQTPIIVSGGDSSAEPPSYVRYLKFDEMVNEQLTKEEKLARTELKVEELRRVHSNAKKLLILLHDHPDPDSIASALALRTLLKRNKQTTVIGHLGEKISRPENVAMIELLDIDLTELEKDELSQFDSIAMVDVQPPFFGEMNVEVDSVIDHHPQIANYNSKFREICSEEGATSTIMTGFLRAAQLEISERLSTALLYGIKTDTVTLNRDANRDDIEAFTFLYPQANLALLRKIERAEIPSDEVRVFGQALADHWVKGTIFFVNLGKVEREYLIPKMADFGIQVKGMEWSVAYGILGNAHLVISVRNVGYTRSGGRMVRELFRDMGSAGGHRSAAKAVIPIANIKSSLGKTSQATIKKWLTNVVSDYVAEKASAES